uniref:Hexosyltransferase n=1 Tax=Caligus rogercresseyi TaxID=217165 RepID=C1BRE7_CALRO|nr:Beta-1,3-galactosyltransferase 1 [Caligus rogercresseyi]
MFLLKISNPCVLLIVFSLLTLLSTTLQILNLLRAFSKNEGSFSRDQIIAWHEVPDFICHEDVTRIRSRCDFNLEYGNASGYKGPIISGWPPSKSRRIEDYIPRGYEKPGRVFPKNLNLQNTRFLIIIHSRWKSFETRRVIRETWGKTLKALNRNSSYIFILGMTKAPHYLDDQLKEEIQAHGDIFQGDFIDSYNNLTLKSISALKFITKTASWRNKPRRLLKVDDDVFLNVPLLLKTVFSPLIWCREPYLSGVILGNFTPHIVLPGTRRVTKWGVPSYMLSEGTYPSFLSGSAYLFSFATAECLFQEAYHIPYFHLEDIFITSFTATRCNIEIQPLKGIVHWRTRRNRVILAKSFALHYSNKEEMKSLHRKVMELYQLDLDP